MAAATFNNIAVIKPLDCNNLSRDWPHFRKRFAVYLRKVERQFCNTEAEKDTLRIDLFYSSIGQGEQKIFGKLFPNANDDFSNITWKQVLEEFEEYCAPKRNLCLESFKLQKLVRQPGQSFQDFYYALKKQAAECDFKCTECKLSYEGRMIKDRIVTGVRDKRLQLLLLEKNDKHLEDVVTICKNFEAVQLCTEGRRGF